MAKVKGFKMYLNPRDKASFSFLAGSIEEFETEIFEREIKEGMAVLDIGAHVGYYTLIAAQIVGEGGKVFAFEPCPENFSLLKKNVEVNRFRNVVLVKKAVSKETRKIKLFLSNSDGVTHRICDFGNGRKSILIDCVALDDFFKNGDQVDFIKMDIEGAEPLAFQGMANLVARCRNLKMITEFYPEALRLFGSSPEEYLTDVMKCGFETYYMNSRKRKLETANMKTLAGTHIATLFCRKMNEQF